MRKLLDAELLEALGTLLAMTDSVHLSFEEIAFLVTAELVENELTFFDDDNMLVTDEATLVTTAYNEAGEAVYQLDADGSLIGGEAMVEEDVAEGDEAPSYAAPLELVADVSEGLADLRARLEGQGHDLGGPDDLLILSVPLANDHCLEVDEGGLYSLADAEGLELATNVDELFEDTNLDTDVVSADPTAGPDADDAEVKAVA